MIDPLPEFFLLRSNKLFHPSWEKIFRFLQPIKFHPFFKKITVFKIILIYKQNEWGLN